MARPKKEISEEQVRELAAIGCTIEEMATVLGCGEKTLRRRFDRVIKEGWEEMKTSLRRFQFIAAKKGNPAMLIWLGKQYLGQRDKIETEEVGESAVQQAAIFRQMVSATYGSTVSSGAGSMGGESGAA